MGKKIGFTYDLKTDVPMHEGYPVDYDAELDSQETVDFICAGIEASGHTVVPIGNAKNLLKKLPDLGVDIVFNICEGLDNRNREAQVPILLEMHGIPYVGSDALTMSLALDKIMTKRVLIAERIPTPHYLGIDTLDTLIDLDHMAFPVIVKLRREGSSKGLDDNSVVHNRRELQRQVEYLWECYHKSPLLIEQCIVGREFTVPIIGNGSPEVLPVVQVLIHDKLDLGEIIYTFARLKAPDLNYVCPAKIDAALEKKLADLAIRTYQAVGCRDFGRVDIRVDKGGNAYVLEINPLPALAKDDAFNIAPQAMGRDYNWAIQKIIDSALEHYGMK